MLRYFPPVRTSYAAADAVQQRLSRALLDAKKGGPPAQMALLAYEMEPTYTLGRRQKHGAAAVQAAVGPHRDYSVVETLRGGHTTFHGPGQLVLYPILDLQRLGVKVRDYVCILEKSIIAVLGNNYGIAAEQRPQTGLNGVFLADRAQRKIASVGVHVRRNVTSHGLALNVDLDPFWFRQIVACNLPDAEMVSMARFTPHPHLPTVSDQLVAELAARLGVPLERSSQPA